MGINPSPAKTRGTKQAASAARSGGMVIRWLGAFRKNGSLEEALKWELNQTAVSALTAERLPKGRSAIHHARVGLLVKNSAVLRRFRSDVWSAYRENGKLYATRKQGVAYSQHTECWVKPKYLAIVVKGKVSHEALQACIATGLDVLRLTRDGRLVQIANSGES